MISEDPITRAEMQALLEPMQKCLQCIEGKLHELSQARMAEKEGDTVTFFEDDNNTESVVHGSEAQPDDKVSYDAEESRGNPDSKVNKVTDDSNGLQQQPMSPSRGSQRTSEHLHSQRTSDLLEQHKINRVLASMTKGKEETHSKFAEMIIQKLEQWHEHWQGIEIPTFDNPIFLIVNTKGFGVCCMLAIFFNTLLVAYSADWHIRNSEQDEPQLLYVLETMFTIIFLVELIARLAAHRIYFFFNHDMAWNLFDLVLVAISLFEFIVQHAAGDQAGNNISFMRILRLLKMARIFRALRTFKFFKELMVMLVSLRNSLLSLFWGLLFLAFVLYMFSLIYAQALVDYLKADATVDADTRDYINLRFGSLLDVVITLYASMTGGEDWGIYYMIMVKVGPIYGFLFLLFTFFFFFGLMNILTGLVVEKAMAEGGPDRSDQIVKRRRLLAESRNELIQICRSMDADNSGRISYQEFREWVSNPVMLHYMETVGLDVRDIEHFFSAVSQRHAECKFTKEGEVTIDQFVDGCLHMKGTATAIDMQKQLYEMDILLRNLRHMDNAVCQRLSRIEKAMAYSLHSQKIGPNVSIQSTTDSRSQESQSFRL